LLTIYYIYYTIYLERIERDDVKMEELKNIIRQDLQKAEKATLALLKRHKSIGYYEYFYSTYLIDLIYEKVVYNNLEELLSDNLENKDSQELIQKAQIDILLFLEEMNNICKQEGAFTEFEFYKAAEELLAKYE